MEAWNTSVWNPHFQQSWGCGCCLFVPDNVILGDGLYWPTIWINYWGVLVLPENHLPACQTIEPCTFPQPHPSHVYMSVRVCPIWPNTSRQKQDIDASFILKGWWTKDIHLNSNVFWKMYSLWSCGKIVSNFINIQYISNAKYTKRGYEIFRKNSGSKPKILVTRDQTSILLNFVSAFFEDSPMTSSFQLMFFFLHC